MTPCATFTLGPYTIQQRHTPGRDCPLYWVFLGSVKIGASLSVPDLGCCKWLERHQREQTGYAYSTENLSAKPYGFTTVHKVRNRKVGAPRKPKTQQDIAKALAGG